MKQRRGSGPTSLELTALHPPTEQEVAVGARAVAVLRRLAQRDDVALEEGPVAAQRLAVVAARHVEQRVDALMAVEIGSAALAAPWLATEESRAEAIGTGMRVAERLLPVTDVDPGRDCGSWGAVAGAVAIDAGRGLRRSEWVAGLAAALVLESIPDVALVDGYIALRVGYAASTALVAVMLADAGFVADPESLATLGERLGVTAYPVAVTDAGKLGREAADLLERSLE